MRPEAHLIQSVCLPVGELRLRAERVALSLQSRWSGNSPKANLNPKSWQASHQSPLETKEVGHLKNGLAMNLR